MVLTKQAPAQNFARKPAISSLSPLISWIDRELTDTYGAEKGRGGDALLKLRRIFSCNSLNSAIGGFYRLLPRLERHHFLLSYRIRRWISLNFEVLVSDPLERFSAQCIQIQQSDVALGSYREDFATLSGSCVDENDVRVVVVQRGSLVSNG